MRRRPTAATLLVVALLAPACSPEGETVLEQPDDAAVTAPEEDPDLAQDEDQEAAGDEDEAADEADASDEAGPETDEPVEITVTTVASGLEAPWEVVFVDGRAFLTERDSGAILELADDGSTEEVANLPIDAGGEGGLLGLAGDPDADGVGFYAYLTTREDNRIVRFAPGEEPEPILTGIPKARIHNGGRIAFGPDGMLYVATGDAGDPPLSQDPDSLAGKILRVAPDGSVPEDNPTAGSPVYALGLRNPQGLTWTEDGTLYAAEFGPDVDDEVNRIEPGGNYGWPEVTGEAGREGFIDPVFVRQPAEASWSGIAALTDGAIPQWEGDLFVAALRGNRLWRLSLDEEGGVADAEELLVGELGRLRQAVQAPDGSLWILTSNRDGRGSPAREDDRILRLGPG
jgi:glucose/arabinose dehydrogenase